MAKRTAGTRPAGKTNTLDTVESSVVAFAEQLGRLVGTVQGKAEGWMDRDALSAQVATVRDGASELLAKLSGGRTAAKAKKAAPRPAPARASKGRSGGVVDAPGKKHRKPVVTAAPKNIATAQAAKLRDAKPMTKTVRRRGRG